MKKLTKMIIAIQKIEGNSLPYNIKVKVILLTGKLEVMWKI